MFDALRGLDLSRYGSAIGRARRAEKALQLQVVPDYSTLFRFMLRIDEQLVTQVLQEVVRRLEKRNPPAAKQDLLWRWTPLDWLQEPLAPFLFVDASIVVARPRPIVIGSNGS